MIDYKKLKSELLIDWLENPTESNHRKLAERINNFPNWFVLEFSKLINSKDIKKLVEYLREEYEKEGITSKKAMTLPTIRVVK